MNWKDAQCALWWLAEFYLSAVTAVLAYIFARNLMLDHRSQRDPPAPERLKYYLTCTAVAVAISLLAYGHPYQMVIFFGVLIAPLLLGVADGLSAEK